MILVSYKQELVFLQWLESLCFTNPVLEHVILTSSNILHSAKDIYFLEHGVQGLSNVCKLGLQNKLLNLSDILFLGMLKRREGHIHFLLGLRQLQIFDKLLLEIVFVFLILELGLDVHNHLPFQLCKVAHI